MKIENNKVLDTFREKTQCESCGNRVGRAEVHHWYPKGSGAASQMDIAFNLIALCRACHQRCEDFNIPRKFVLLYIAHRHGTTYEVVQEAIWLINRLPKGTSKNGILAAADVIGGGVSKLVRETLGG